VATVRITISTEDGPDIEITESSPIRRSGSDLDDVPALLGAAAKRAIHAVAADGDRQNAITAVAERMGVHVQYVD
jgi:soluble P-type ATPase